MIEIKNLSFKYKDSDFKSLNNLSFKVSKGACVVITGASGCGKSTIVKCLNKLIPKFHKGELEGQVLIEGQDIEDLEIYEVSRVVGTVNQDPRGQFFTTDTTSELAFSLENYGTPKEEIFNIIDRIVELLGINYLKDKSIFKISSGERQKLAISCALSLEPKIILFDEPSANLDYLSTLKLGSLLLDLKKQGFTIIVVEHRLFYLKAVLDQLIYIKDGTVKQIVEKDQLDYFRKKDLRGLNIFDEALEIKSATGKEEILSVKNINFKHILKEITFNLYKEDILVIVGENGVGKTTLGKLILGLAKSDGGQINKFNNDVFFVMQDADYQLFGESVLSELNIGNDDVSDALKDEALAWVDLSEYKTAHPFSLSGGQKQRLLIALSYLSKANIIIFDEPTSGLDRLNMERTSNLIKKIAKSKGVIIISHDYELISKICNRVLYLKEAKVKALFDLNEETKNKFQNIFKQIGSKGDDYV